MNRENDARRRRERAAERYRPEQVHTLLVVEAPPSALDRYFYFEDVSAHDSLFRHVVQAVLGERPTRDKLPYLDELRDRGWFVLHMSMDPFGDRSVLAPLLPSLIRRCTVIRPKRILLVGAPLYDLAYEPLATAGLPVEDARIPSPAPASSDGSSTRCAIWSECSQPFGQVCPIRWHKGTIRFTSLADDNLHREEVT